MHDWNKVDPLAKKLWDYGQMGHKLEKAGLILVFGTYNPILATWAAEVFSQGYAPLIIFSGNRSDFTTNWPLTEAETFAALAEQAGVPKENIWLEKEAKNSGENISYTRKLLASAHKNVKTIIAIQKPYSERRMYATLRKQWPEVNVIASSPPLSYDEYMATSPKGKAGSIDTMVGDFQRLTLYAEQGFQIPQKTPQEVTEAFNGLVELGFTKNLLSNNLE